MLDDHVHIDIVFIVFAMLAFRSWKSGFRTQMSYCGW